MNPSALAMRRAGCAALLAAALALAACSSSEPQTFEKAAAEATDSLVAQTGKLPALLARIESTLNTPAWLAATCFRPATHILQKASLERITAAETEFFKRECK